MALQFGMSLRGTSGIAAAARQHLDRQATLEVFARAHTGLDFGFHGQQRDSLGRHQRVSAGRRGRRSVVLGFDQPAQRLHRRAGLQAGEQAGVVDLGVFGDIGQRGKRSTQ